MGFSILSKAFQPGGLNWRLCPVPVFHRTHAVHAFCKEILIDFPEWKIRFHICKIQCLEHISLISTATNGWEIPKGNGWEGRSYNFQIKLCGKRSAMCGCPVVNERNISKSENLEIFCSQNFDCCSGKSFGENSHDSTQGYRVQVHDHEYGPGQGGHELKLHEKENKYIDAKI